MPEVSVIIPTFNYARFLATAMGSVLGQTYRDLELIVVDDGSTDSTRAVVAQFESDLRVRYLYQSNQGDATARIAGLGIANGRYLAFLDSDDYWMPKKLELQLAALQENPRAGAVHSAIYLDTIDHQQRVLSRLLITRPPLQERTLYEELLYRMIITGSHSSVLVPREVLDRVGVFDPSLMSCDWDLWRRISWEHEILYIETPLSVLRHHGSNQTANPDVGANNCERILRKFARDIPPELRFHLPRMRTERYFKLTLTYIKAGRAGSAIRYAAKALFQMWRCPVFTATYFIRFLKRNLPSQWSQTPVIETDRLAPLAISLSSQPAETVPAKGPAPHGLLAEVPRHGSPDPHTPHTRTP